MARLLWVALALGVQFAAPCSAQNAAPGSPSATNHVLDLDGENSWMELPPNLFTNQVVTVEGWVKWRAFGSYSRFFELASAAQHLTVLNTSSNNTLRVERYDRPPFDDLRVTEVPGALRLGQWEHIALVAYTNGVRLYLNGVLVATNQEPLSWKPYPLPPLKNLLGRSLNKNASNTSGDTDLNGQMDEIRIWAGARTAAQIRDNMYRSLNGHEPGLLGLWNFEDVTNGVVKDASPGGHDGRLMGHARIVAEELPQPNRVLQLDGTNSYVELPPHLLDGLKEATIEGWVKWRRFDNWPRLFSFGKGEHLVCLEAANHTNEMDLVVDEQVAPTWVGQTIAAPDAMSAGKWVHVACVFTTNGATLLVNGQEVGSNPNLLLSTVEKNTENFLGTSLDLTNSLDGEMDEIRIWNVARTEKQIRADMNKSLTGREPGLVALYNFDDGTARDVTGHGHDGILRGHAVTVIGQPTLPQTASPIASQPVAAGPENVLELDGLTGHVLLPPHILDGLKTATIEGWVKWRRFDDWARFFTFGKGENAVGLMAGNDTNQINLTLDQQISPWIGQTIPAPDAMKAGEWVHVACVFTTNGATLFVNGQEAGTNPNLLLSMVKENTENILGSTANGGAFLDGQMDEVRIWKVARTEAQIRKDMFKSLTGREQGLLSLWNFNHVTNGVVKDLGPGGFDGQLVGGAKVVAEPIPLESGPMALERVLQLDGTNSFVELPTNAFTHLTTATIEGWINWKSFGWCSRFFDFIVGGQEFNVQNRFLTPDLYLERGGLNHQDYVVLPGALSTDRWVHLAAIVGPETLKLYLNGELAPTNLAHGDFPTAGVEHHNYLGRSNWRHATAVATNQIDEDFHGQMAEVRVWRGERTEEQIREDMFKRLTGSEPGLVGLWNFNDGTARDDSPGGHDGKFFGHATTVFASLPRLVEGNSLTFINGLITDPAGNTLANATIRAEVNGEEITRAASGYDGRYALTLNTPAPAVDLQVIGPGDLADWRRVELNPTNHWQNLDWKLTPSLHVAGKLTALDGKTPLANVVVELVQPAGAETESRSSRREEAPSETPNSELRTPNSSQSLLTSAPTNRVLQLDGKTYLALPTNIVAHLTAATIEGWVKWDKLSDQPDMFDFGDQSGDVWITPGGWPGTQTTTSVLYAFFRIRNQRFIASVPDILRTNQWFHLALVTGPGGMKLYVNGVLMGTNAYTGSFAANTNLIDNQNWVGRDIGPSAQPMTGQMDEFCVWKTARTAQEIRSDMITKLTGHEPGLVGLWNFDDPAHPGRDSSPNEFDGKFIVETSGTNTAQTVAESLPVVVTGRITDASGRGLANAYVEVRRVDGETYRAPTDAEGNYAFTIQASERADLFATDGKRSAYRLDFQPNGEREQRLDWVLTETGVAAPAASRSRREEAPSENPQSEIGNQKSNQSLLKSAPANRVLQLDGNGYLSLPTNLLKPFTEATVEGWVRWDQLQGPADFFDFSRGQSDMWITPGAYLLNGQGPASNPPADLQAGFGTMGHYSSVLVPDILRTNQWFHLALVTGPGGMKLFVNGVLAGTDPFSGSFAAITNLIGVKNFVGRDTYSLAHPMTGQIDEFWIWNVARTAEEIRSDMLTKLTGREPGLVGLWNFDDPAHPGKDSSTNGFDGKIIGEAQTVPEVLPVVVRGRITDASGHGLANAYIEVRRADGETSRSPTDAEGNYAFTIQPSERADLFATDGKRSAYRLGFQPGGEREQRLDWVLTKTGAAASASISSRREEAPSESQKSEVGSQNSSQSLLTSAATGPEPGSVVATVLTAGDGSFDFANLKPGVYQLRCQTPGGRTWFEDGRPFRVEQGMTAAEMTRLKSLEWAIEPFRKGRWTKFSVLDGLPVNETGASFSPRTAGFGSTRHKGCRVSMAVLFSISLTKTALF